MVALEVHDRHMAQQDITDFPMTLIAAVSGRDRYPQSNLPMFCHSLVSQESTYDEILIFRTNTIPYKEPMPKPVAELQGLLHSPSHRSREVFPER